MTGLIPDKQKRIFLSLKHQCLRALSQLSGFCPGIVIHLGQVCTTMKPRYLQRSSTGLSHCPSEFHISLYILSLFSLYLPTYYISERDLITAQMENIPGHWDSWDRSTTYRHHSELKSGTFKPEFTLLTHSF
jgi:hypothetical protein